MGGMIRTRSVQVTASFTFSLMIPAAADTQSESGHSAF